MDPLSITTGVIALGTLAVTVTKTVNDIKKSLRTADQSLDDLTTEVRTLTSYLTTVGDSLSDARSSSLDVVQIDDKLWDQTLVALSACNATLKEITVVLSDVNKAAKSRNGLNRKAKIAACLHDKSTQLASLRERIGKSNCALQTVLHIIQVHISIRNRATQDVIMGKLEELKVSIDTSTLRSRNHGMDRLAEVPINQSLKDLAREARRFHSAASSASSTSGSTEDSQSVAAPWQFYPGAEMSLAGDFTEAKLERVHDYLQGSGPTLFSRPRRPEPLPSPPPSMPASDQDLDIQMRRTYRDRNQAQHRLRSRRGPHVYPPPRFPSFQAPAPEREEPYSGITVKYEDERDSSEHEDEDDGDDTDESDEEDEAELEKEFLQELTREIEEYICTGKYAQAISQIEEVMLNHNAASEPSLMSTLRTQLALCHIMQGQLAPAEHLMGSHVARFKKDRNPVVCSLLHALAILQYDHNRLDVAEKACKLSYFGKKQLLEDKLIAEESLWETVGLLAVIYAVKGETMKANTFRRKWPAGFVYQQPGSAKNFLLNDKAMEGMVRADASTLSVVPGYFEMWSPQDEPPRASSRRTGNSGPHSDKQAFGSDYPSDSGDESTSPASSVSPITPTSNLRRRFTQLFRGRNKRTSPSPVSPPNKRRPSVDSGYSSGLTPVEDIASSASSDQSPWKLFQPMKRKKTTKTKKAKNRFQVRNVVRVNHPTADDYLDVDGRHFDQQSMNHSTLSGSTMVEPDRSPVTIMGAIYEVEEDISGLKVFPEIGIPELDGHCTEQPLPRAHGEKPEQTLGSSLSQEAETKNDPHESVIGASDAAANPLPTIRRPTKPVLRLQPVNKAEPTLYEHIMPPSPVCWRPAPSFDPRKQTRAVLPPATTKKISNIASLLTCKTSTFLEAETTRLLLRMALADLSENKWSKNPTLEKDVTKALEVVGMKASRLRAVAHAKQVEGRKMKEVMESAAIVDVDKGVVSGEGGDWWEGMATKPSAQAEDDGGLVQDKPSFSRASTLDVAELEVSPIEPDVPPSPGNKKASTEPDVKDTASGTVERLAKTDLDPETEAPYFVPGELMEEKVSTVNLTKRSIQAYTPPKETDRRGSPTSPRAIIRAYTPTAPRKETGTRPAAEEYVPAIAAHYVAAYGYMRRWKTSLTLDERDCLEEMGISG